MNPLRLCVLAATGLLLSACGSTSPGAAAMVDGRAISMSTLDDTAQAICEQTLWSAELAQGPTSIDNAELRRQAATILVLDRVATAIVEERGLKVPTPVEIDPSTAINAAASPDTFVDAFGDRATDVANLTATIEDLYAMAALIGGDDNALPVTEENQSDLIQAGFAIVTTGFADHDVTFAPRLGLADSGESNDSIGSLSVAPIDFEAATPDELPGPLACRA